ncbi:MAG: family 10 glycosylhydrolase [Bacteroidetes bacterium]|nr:family 10 glycosylhydrolase [Bacteroidota bacterium]
MKHFLAFVLFIFIAASSFSQTVSPKREFRAAWISTVANIDWPSSSSNSTETKKADLIKILDYLKAANLNAVVFQIRPACDAMYASEIEPWSYWLTGTQGKAPSPFFDPLEFAIEEAHKRGMELHAWFNPYRVKRASWGFQLAESNIAKKNPHWVLTVNGDQILDPGLPEVREHVLSVIKDVVRRYDIDAVHFDDYFYLSGISNQDDATFAAHTRGFTNRGDWRRDNVNELLRMIYAGIQAEKPHVKFGQSPAGIWKKDVPPGIFGNDNYSVIYSDAVAWLSEQIIDYLTPQLYWQIGGNQDYSKLMPWWANVRNGRHIYPGLAFYRVGESTFDKTQLGRMIAMNRTVEGVYGEVFFTANNFAENRQGNTDTLKNHYYKYKSLVPSLEWKDQTPPAAVNNLRYDRVDGIGTTALTWNIPASNNAAFYAIYSYDTNPGENPDLTNPVNIFDVTSRNFYIVDSKFPTTKKYYVVTALSENHVEGERSSVFEFQPASVQPAVPTLVAPAIAEENVRDSVNLIWNYAANAVTYRLQVSASSAFSPLFLEQSEILDTAKQISGLQGESTYYWRVRSENYAGQSSYSNTFNFNTGFPKTPQLISPTDVTVDVALEPLFKWSSNPKANSYNLRVAEGLSFVTTAMIINETLTDTFFQSGELKAGTYYSWQVSASNEYGRSQWPAIFKFRTKIFLPEIPALVYPADSQNDIGASVDLRWNKAAYADKYRIQVSESASFSPLLLDEKSVYDTTFILTGLKGVTKYYWRVKSENNGGGSNYSIVRNFETGFPIKPVLLYPPDVTLNIELDPVIRWTSTKTAIHYALQVSKSLDFNLNSLVVDKTVADTVYPSQILDKNTFYSWRVQAKNNIGISDWTGIFKFKTSPDSITTVEQLTGEIPTEFELYQNYPNPFNPSTTIKFSIPNVDIRQLPDASSLQVIVKLSVHNALGQQVAVLVNESRAPGEYEVEFNGSSLPSGIYFYKISAGDFSLVKKMMLVK